MKKKMSPGTMKPHISMARAPSANIIGRWELELKQIEAEAFVATAADDDNDLSRIKEVQSGWKVKQ